MPDEPAAITPWGIEACAHQQIKQHGTGAEQAALDRWKALEDAGDAEGVAVWKAILRQIVLINLAMFEATRLGKLGH